MNRLLLSIILSLSLVCIATISEGLSNSENLIYGWICSGILPLWSLMSISLWYDVGRLLLSKEFTLLVNKPDWIRSSVFIFWMSVIFTYVVWVHISLYCIPLLIMIPFLGISYRDILIHDWSIKPPFTLKHLGTTVAWFISSYVVYWVLTICWILVRVWLLDMTTDGYIVFIE